MNSGMHDDAHPFRKIGKSPRTKKRSGEVGTLEQDLQFSSEEELDEVPLHEFEDNKQGILISAEMPVEGTADDDSQQVAEAMVQLGTMGYYQTENEADGTAEHLMFKGKCLIFFHWYRLIYYSVILQKRVWMWIRITTLQNSYYPVTIR